MEHGLNASMKAPSESSVLPDERTVAETARHQTEQLKAHLAAIVESSDDAIISKDTNGIVLSWNKTAERIFGFTSEEAVGRPIVELVIPKDRVSEERVILERIRRGERIDHFETIRRRKNGEQFPVSLSVSPIKDSSGRIVGAAKIARDITDQKRAAESVKAALREKEVLLKEIHHRVKNNLQLISSLLNLQAASIHDTETIRCLQESRNRIKSIALVHEQLYSSGDLEVINMPVYFDKLIQQWRGMCAPGISLECSVEGGEFALDTAVTCGLMVNELISNAIKHAFPEGKGSVRVELIAESPDSLRLVVRDDGAGIPAGIDIATTTSLGLRLVDSLARQLGGQIQFDRTEGTRAVVLIPIPTQAAHG
jgi:PAS domain S-box-containing protein